jgi:Tfp pilus assembly protein PilF
MRETRSYGSVRGAAGNSRPYREPGGEPDIGRPRPTPPLLTQRRESPSHITASASHVQNIVAESSHHALVYYSEAIRLDPRYALAFNNRGIVYRDKGDLDHAVADYGEAIRINPRFANAFANRGDAYRDKGEFQRALADYSEAVRINPRNGSPSAAAASSGSSSATSTNPSSTMTRRYGSIRNSRARSMAAAWPSKRRATVPAPMRISRPPRRSGPTSPTSSRNSASSDRLP